MATYQLAQTSSDGTPIEPISFTIPDEAGTYRLTFTTSDGKTFTGDVEKKVSVINIDQDIGVTVGGKQTVYEFVNAGKGTMSNLAVSVSETSFLTASATYYEDTGMIEVKITNKSSFQYSGAVFVTGTLTKIGGDVYRIEVTLSNGETLLSNITI